MVRLSSALTHSTPLFLYAAQKKSPAVAGLTRRSAPPQAAVRFSLLSPAELLSEPVHQLSDVSQPGNSSETAERGREREVEHSARSSARYPDSARLSPRCLLSCPEPKPPLQDRNLGRVPGWAFLLSPSSSSLLVSVSNPEQPYRPRSPLRCS
ncbi:hypothetical protein MHYP_G00290410 [Metynnis hypsauchen]